MGKPVGLPDDVREAVEFGSPRPPEPGDGQTGPEKDRLQTWTSTGRGEKDRGRDDRRRDDRGDRGGPDRPVAAAKAATTR